MHPPSRIGIPSIPRDTRLDVVVHHTRAGFRDAKSGGKIVFSEEAWRKKKPTLFFDSLDFLQFEKSSKQVTPEMRRTLSAGCLPRVSPVAQVASGSSSYCDMLSL